MATAYSRHLFIKTNHNCNLNCIYCYERNKSNSTFDEIVIASKLEQILQNSTEFGTKIKLVGGEPFLAFPKIKKLCETIWAKEFSEAIHFQITTNGTLVHGEIQEWLYQNRDRIDCKLSIDGNKASQDINRPNSFEKIDIPFFVKTWPECITNMVVTAQTIHSFAKNVEFLHSCGFTNIVPLFAVLTNWSEFNLEKEFYLQLLELAQYYLANPHIPICKTLKIPIERTLDENYDKVLCEIGRKIVYDIESDKYYPCHLFFPSVCRDNSPNDLDLIDFSRRSQYEKPICLSCPFINVCHTCYAANYIERGSLSNRDMSICKYRKVTFLVASKLEYNRIMNLQEISDNDYLIMQAIHDLLPELNQIEKSLTI